MNRKIVTGALIALAAGIAVFYYKNRNKVNEAAADAYDKLNKGIDYTKDKADSIFS